MRANNNNLLLFSYHHAQTSRWHLAPPWNYPASPSRQSLLLQLSLGSSMVWTFTLLDLIQVFKKRKSFFFFSNLNILSMLLCRSKYKCTCARLYSNKEWRLVSLDIPRDGRPWGRVHLPGERRHYRDFKDIQSQSRWWEKIENTRQREFFFFFINITLLPSKSLTSCVALFATPQHQLSTPSGDMKAKPSTFPASCQRPAQSRPTLCGSKRWAVAPRYSWTLLMTQRALTRVWICSTLVTTIRRSS